MEFAIGLSADEGRAEAVADGGAEKGNDQQTCKFYF
jgi:argininosuccinate synthase